MPSWLRSAPGLVLLASLSLCLLSKGRGVWRCGWLGWCRILLLALATNRKAAQMGKEAGKEEREVAAPNGCVHSYFAWHAGYCMGCRKTPLSGESYPDHHTRKLYEKASPSRDVAA